MAETPMEMDKKEIFSNPTLGEAANGKFLDVEQAQINENRNAEREGRKPRKVVPNPKWPGKNTNLPESRFEGYHFEDEDNSSDQSISSSVENTQSSENATVDLSDLDEDDE